MDETECRLYYHIIKDTLLISKKKVKVRVFGNSMKPSILDHDIVLIEPILSSYIKKNDIIAFWRQATEIIVIHRVIKIDENYIITKGDNLKNNDGKIKLELILGRVVKYIFKSSNSANGKYFSRTSGICQYR